MKPAYLCVIFVFQGYREKEKGEGTLWQFGLSGGGVEGPEEEEEKVNVHIITHLPITCSLLKRAGGEFSHETSGTELCFFYYNSNSQINSDGFQSVTTPVSITN